MTPWQGEGKQMENQPLQGWVRERKLQLHLRVWALDHSKGKIDPCVQWKGRPRSGNESWYCEATSTTCLEMWVLGSQWTWVLHGPPLPTLAIGSHSYCLTNCEMVTSWLVLIRHSRATAWVCFIGRRWGGQVGSQGPGVQFLEHFAYLFLIDLPLLPPHFCLW